MNGPAYWKAGSGKEILKGCWFEDDPSSCGRFHPEFLVGLGHFDTSTPPQGWGGYVLRQSNDHRDLETDGWKDLYRLTESKSDRGSVLTSFEDSTFLEAFEAIQGRSEVFCDVRDVTGDRLHTWHTLPVRAWLQSDGPEIIPPYYPDEVLPRAAAGTGDGPGFLLMHGYTGNPGNWDHFIPHLQDDAYLAPLLPGHGLAPEQFADHGMNDWLETVGFGAEKVSESNDPTIAIGLSMGGALSLIEWERFDAIIIINTPLRIPDWRRFFLPIFEWFKSNHAFEDSDKIVPVSSFRDLQNVLTRCRRVMEDVQVPVLVINHGNDRTVSENHGRVFASTLPHADHLLLEEGIHESPTDPEVARLLHEKISEWLEKKDVISR